MGSGRALAPVISSSTIGFHYGKHHRDYVDTLDKLVTGTPLEGVRLEELVRETAGKPDKTVIFNNAAQDWNHTFNWNSLAPGGGGKPGAELSAKIESAFGSFEEFRKAFLAASTSQFGSGWVRLVLERGSKRLALLKTSNAETPISGTIAQSLAVLDVWEHAYYLDYQNRRIEYATALFDKLLNCKRHDRPTFIYAGAGSREAPPEALLLATLLATRLEAAGKILHAHTLGRSQMRSVASSCRLTRSASSISLLYQFDVPSCGAIPLARNVRRGRANLQVGYVASGCFMPYNAMDVLGIQSR